MILGAANSDLERSNVLGVRFVADRFEVAVAAIVRVLKDTDRDSLYLCPTGAHGVIEATKDAAFRRILNDAAFNVPDGQPVVVVSRLLGHRKCQRAFGPDIMWATMEVSVALGTSHFFYGGKEGVADRLATVVRERIPGIRVAGTYCPPFRPLSPDEEQQVVEVINSSGADVVWVGLSTPKQERWIQAMRDRLDVKLIGSVGAAFDYHTGSISPAPRWMKRAALEWFYRLVQEPRRLWRRYVEVVPRFLFLATLQVTGLRRFPTD